ncbi:hypothetical protein B2J88_51830 [Rhodococcus sp. SRB_17]|nr:hypothetical protein [Rhodococcus sp. SRB_17]
MHILTTVPPPHYVFVGAEATSFRGLLSPVQHLGTGRIFEHASFDRNTRSIHEFDGVAVRSMTRLSPSLQSSSEKMPTFRKNADAVRHCTVDAEFRGRRTIGHRRSPSPMVPGTDFYRPADTRAQQSPRSIHTTSPDHAALPDLNEIDVFHHQATTAFD